MQCRVCAGPHSFPMRHTFGAAQHEWQVFRSIKLPDDKVLVPGVVDVTSNYVEHPQLVADRLVQFAKIVGREQLIASTDSGFAAFAGDRMVDPRIASKKLESLVAPSS